MSSNCGAAKIVLICQNILILILNLKEKMFFFFFREVAVKLLQHIVDWHKFICSIIYFQ